MMEPVETWLLAQTADVQDSVAFGVRLLEEKGPLLGRPYVDAIKGSRFPNMKELRIQHEGKPYRVLFAFDPRPDCNSFDCRKEIGRGLVQVSGSGC